MADGTKDAPLQATRVEPDAGAVAPAAAAIDNPPAEKIAPAAADVPAAGAAAAEVVEAKPELTTDKPSLLDAFEKKEEPKADAPKVDAKDADKDAGKPDGDKKDAKSDKPAADGDKPDAKDVKPEAKDGAEPAKDAAAAEPAKLEPVAYEYTVPETLALDEATKTELHGALDGFRQDPAKGAQGLVDLANKSIQAAVDRVRTDQHKAFNDTRSSWQKDVLADEEIGGAGHQTSMRAIARMRDLFVPEKERAAFDQFLRVTGAGDHPQFLKLLHQAARYIDEPSLPPAGAKPPPNNGKAPGRRRDTIYDHPSSQKQRS
jgi:hypothetical protein